VLERLIQQ